MKYRTNNIHQSTGRIIFTASTVKVSFICVHLLHIYRSSIIIIKHNILKHQSYYLHTVLMIAINSIFYTGKVMNLDL